MGAVVVEKPEVSEVAEVTEPVQPIDCSEDLSQEKCQAVKEAVCEDYNEEGESSFALPPERDHFTHSNLEIIDENEVIEDSKEKQQVETESEEEVDDTKPVDIPIKNDDFFLDDDRSSVHHEPEIPEEPEEPKEPQVIPVSVQEEPQKHHHQPSTFTPIQARNAEMHRNKKQENKQKSSSMKKNLNAEPNFNIVAIGSVIIVLAAVAMRFFS